MYRTYICLSINLNYYKVQPCGHGGRMGRKLCGTSGSPQNIDNAYMEVHTYRVARRREVLARSEE
jgi:hypothetical protein